MNIVILGSGGREHALCEKIYLSKKVKKIYSIPGNAGTSDISENINLPLNDFSKIEKFIKDKNIDLIVVGPEQPLVDGIVDYFENKNINIFGPNKIASQLEGSKIFTKKLCEKYNIPSANFGIFESAEKEIEAEALTECERHGAKTFNYNGYKVQLRNGSKKIDYNSVDQVGQLNQQLKLLKADIKGSIEAQRLVHLLNSTKCFKAKTP